MSNMLRSGLCSITHRKLSVDEVIAVTCKCGLAGIEWGGDVHVPHGEVELAETVLDKTLFSGLLCPSYGSYYKVGVSEDVGLDFGKVLDTAEGLGVPTIRVWAGGLNREDASTEYVRMVTAETRRIAALALARGMTLAFEYHGGTLTNTPAGCRELVEAVDRENVQTYWQPLAGASQTENIEGLKSLLPWIGNIHVFHWVMTTRPDGDRQVERRPLAEGAASWTAYLDVLAGTDREHWLYLEFSVDDDPEMTLKDAHVLRDMTEGR